MSSLFFCIVVPVCTELHLFLSMLLLFADSGLLDTRTLRIKLTLRSTSTKRRRTTWLPSIHSPLLLLHLHLRQPLPYHLALLQVSPHSVGPAAMDPPLDTLLSRLTACATFYFFLAVLVVDYLVKGNANDKTLLALPFPPIFSRLEPGRRGKTLCSFPHAICSWSNSCASK